MNEHDSERIAGLARGRRAWRPTDDLDDADVVVLNTCCIRENADNKLYGHLGHLKALKDAQPDLQIAVGGCLAQKDRDLIQRAGAGHVDVVFGTHNVGQRRRRCSRGRAPRARSSRSSRSTSAFPSALPARRDVPHAAWVTIQIGCDNSCAFCIVPSVRGKEISRPHGRHRRRGRGARRRRRHRGHAAGPERQLLRPRPHASAARCSPQLLRDGRRGRRHRSACASRAPPQGPAARDDRGHGRVRRRCASTCTSRCSRAATASLARDAPRLHRGALPRTAAPRRAPRSPTWRSPPTSSSASPARPTTTSSARSRWSAEAGYDAAYTFVFSPRPGTEAADDDRRVRRPETSSRSASSASEVVVERSALAARHEARVGHDGGGARRRGRRSATPTCGRDARGRTSSSTSRPAPASPSGALRRRRASRTPRRTTCAASSSSVTRRAPRHKTRIPVAARLSVATSRSSGRRRRASRRWRWRSPGPADVEIVSVDSMQVYRGMDIGTAKPTAAERAEVPHHLIDIADPSDEYTVSRVPDRRARGDRRHRRARPARAARRRHRACTCGPPSTGCRSPPQFPDVKAELEAEPDTAALYDAFRPSWIPTPPRRDGTDEPAPASCAPSRWRSAAAGRSRRSVPGLDTLPADAVPPGRPLARPRAAMAERIRGRFAAHARRRVRRRGRAPGACAGLSRTARQALGYREAASTTSSTAVPLDDALDEAVARTRPFARRQRCWFRRDPRIAWFGTGS